MVRATWEELTARLDDHGLKLLSAYRASCWSSRTWTNESVRALITEAHETVGPGAR
ncbi:MAG: hypothetical protein M3445_03330 [Actinomycetota bacterium]|nr:hypothetical protein [Actinomycetota bacterium]